MTTLNESLTRPVKNARPSGQLGPAANVAAGFVATLAGSAIASGLAGLALNKGFGISVPFLAGFFLIVAFLFFLKQAAGEVAEAWHGSAVRHASQVSAASLVGMNTAQKMLDGASMEDMEALIEALAAKRGE